MHLPDDADLLAKILFYVILASTAIYAGVVTFTILLPN